MAQITPHENHSMANQPKNTVIDLKDKMTANYFLKP
jgi:hypothetical protein